MKRIFLVLSLCVFAALPAHAEKCLSYYGDDSEVISKTRNGVIIAVKVTVSNRCKKEVTGYAKFNALTSDDFLIGSRALIINTKVYDKKTVSEQMFLSHDEYNKVSKIVFEEAFEQ